jgi:hypothetical protein
MPGRGCQATGPRRPGCDGSLNGQANTKTNAPHADPAIPTNRAVLFPSIGAPRRINAPSPTTGGVDRAIILAAHWMPFVQSTLRARLSRSSGPALMHRPAARQTAKTSKTHRRPRRGEYVGLKDRIAGMPPITAIMPRLTTRHQKVGWCILIGISGKAAPSAKNTTISATQIVTMITMSRHKRLRRTGLRSPVSRSISESKDIRCPRGEGILVQDINVTHSNVSMTTDS